MPEILINQAFLAIVGPRSCCNLLRLVSPYLQAFPTRPNDSTQHERDIKRQQRAAGYGAPFFAAISTLLENADQPPCLASVLKREGNKYFK
jgi:hypothetical protein